MRVAIVHDWLTGMRGGERILDVFCQLFPQAEIFTLIYRKGVLSPTIENRRIHVSFLQNIPSIFENYRNYLPLFPDAIESFKLRDFDLVISSSHCVAKGIKKPKTAFHFSYCYTPMRYVWVFFDQYFKSYPFWKQQCIRLVSEYLKQWDIRTLKRVDEFVAISETIKERIKTVYGRDSRVIYPPVELEKFSTACGRKKEDYYLCVSALVPYKRIDIMIEAFNMLKDKKLVVVGDGQLMAELKKKKKSSNITLRGWVHHDELREIYQKARAFIFAAEEDFGIAPVEAQAAGVPVIAFGKGGTAETVIPLNASHTKEPTGIFFFEQSPESLIHAIHEFEQREREFRPDSLRENARRFSEENFKQAIIALVREKMGEGAYA